ncbi:hypothetical protein P152DRAFT_456406 [Eremomyces bilateralis CBS 781.70]|uniref:Uncharacterized protein n=1 Tax=Eremomyces bilateralis CBS 781.70 TaxID=1392243 RepID=A0A6G1G817_9PEZI|nr:uncharacterized protein P152DRAFT_456406 [Eremomyces bilateralis CBS 781.70]KAF1814174.1 hypothetical protein P152DRAFT_456406 [Eremomyces bilateralis CBS 781.70]
MTRSPGPLSGSRVVVDVDGIHHLHHHRHHPTIPQSSPSTSYPDIDIAKANRPSNRPSRLPIWRTSRRSLSGPPNISTMPPSERSNHANPPRPLMPTLASNRTAKTPITPRLAASKSPIVSSAGSTFPRPTVRGDSAASSPRSPIKDEISTPVKSFLNSNVTPRSSARKSRVDSASSTPSGTPVSGTPNTVKSASTADMSRVLSPGSASSADRSTPGRFANGSRRPLSMVGTASSTHNAPSVASPSITSPTGSLNGRLGVDNRLRAGSPLFFHANDPKVQEPAPPRPAKKPAAFFYANGIQEEGGPKQPDVPSPPLSSVSTRSQAKFFHADGREEGQRHAAPTPPPMVVSPEPILRDMMNPLMRRSPSPTKDSIHLSYRKGASQIMRPTNHPRSVVSPVLQAVSEQDNTRRRSSSGSATPGHGKSSSISSIDSNPSRRPRSISKAAATIPEPRSTPTPISAPSTRTQTSAALPLRRSDTSQNSLSPTSLSSGPANTAPPLPSPTSTSRPQSPTKPTPPPTNFDEMAANARRERKVLDLEISNSSLLAINRQLEREVRKQKGELRRFRRLTRAGRLSEFSAATARSSLAVGEAPDSGTDSNFGLSDLSESEDEDDSTDESSLSAAANDARLMKDEKRLRLDLEKHRELLVDSQRMNQSLRRCLGWTEELIVSGKKALEYRVRVSDVKLGGRVLHHADEEDAIGAAVESDGEMDESRDLMEEIGAFSAWMGKKPGEALVAIRPLPGETELAGEKPASAGHVQLDTDSDAL